MAYEGYNLKATKNNAIFPEKYIEAGSWDASPRQKEYLKAYRDDNTRKLTKVIASGRKSTIRFTIKSGITLAGRTAINNFFNNNQMNSEGDIALRYWDDDALVYRTGNFYRPNINFKQITHSSNDIKYDSFDIELIEI